MTSQPQLPEEHLAGNVRRLRDRKGLSQEQLADEMTGRGRKWHQNTVYRIEVGKQKDISHGEAITLAGILGVPVDVLTRPGPEAAEISLVDQAAVSLRRNWANSATAIDGLLAAREEAGKAARQAQRSEHESVRQAGAALAADLERMTVTSVTGDANQPAAGEATG